MYGTPVAPLTGICKPVSGQDYALLDHLQRMGLHMWNPEVVSQIEEHENQVDAPEIDSRPERPGQKFGYVRHLAEGAFLGFVFGDLLLSSLPPLQGTIDVVSAPTGMLIGLFVVRTFPRWRRFPSISSD